MPVAPLRLLATILVLCATLAAAAQAQAQTTRAEILSAALAAGAASDWPEALRLADRLPDRPARDVVLWHHLRAPQGSFEDYLSFLGRNPDWPGLPLMRARGEAAIPAGASLAQLQAFFGPDAPQTGTGSLRLAEALRAAGRGPEADDLIVKAWRGFALDAETEARIR